MVRYAKKDGSRDSNLKSVTTLSKCIGYLLVQLQRVSTRNPSTTVVSSSNSAGPVEEVEFFSASAILEAVVSVSCNVAAILAPKKRAENLYWRRSGSVLCSSTTAVRRYS